ncbi:hypothetical protein MITS9504_03490 [Synechococcus sp. MIT S9504]|nr:hypothetical protein MITS9504_03490 [Synechococcus sp. MIT S9504]
MEIRIAALVYHLSPKLQLHMMHRALTKRFHNVYMQRKKIPHFFLSIEDH